MLLCSVLLCVASTSLIEAFVPRREYHHHQYDDYDNVTKIREGFVKGCPMRARNGREFMAFKGIPYAKAPVGCLRFKAPEPAEPWDDIRDGCIEAPQCAQKNYLYANPTFEGEEDCLFLNVYTHDYRCINCNIKSKKPVMVYIHGGGFFSGSGISSIHGPEYFMEKDVVLVTLNYRLGVLGFFSTADDTAPGNFGLKDQILALKWVQNNIENFGGDPDRVTIFGQSAGAASVHYHVLNENLKGLFHRAISQSGSALNLWATPKQSLFIAQIQGQFLGCSQNNTAEMVDCIRDVDVKDLVESGDKFKFWDIDPLTVYVPSLENRTEKNPEPAVDEHPLSKVKHGRFQKIPMIMGVMTNEGNIRAAPITSKSELRNQLNSRWDELGPQLLALTESVPAEKVSKLWQDINTFYMKHGPRIDVNNNDNIQDFINVYSDRSFVYGVYQSALGHAKYAPVYFYRNNYNGSLSYSPYFAATNETINHKFTISHCDDLIYLFRTPSMFPDLVDIDLDFSRLLVSLWTDFAAKGKPLNSHWPPLNGQTAVKDFRHMCMEGPVKIQAKNNVLLTMSSHFFPDRMEFWRNQDVNENKR